MSAKQKDTTKEQKLEALIRKMIRTFGGLGQDHWARIDARICEIHFRRKARKLGMKI